MKPAPALVARAGAAPVSISLVLGAGGARGYAHIGAIEELEAQGFRIRSIAGSSMGALIGGIHATGKLDVYRDWVRPLQKFDVLRLLDWTLSGGGFIKGDRIIGVLRELIGDIDIEALPIAYTAVAVDLEAQREVWFSRGPLFDAIRASIAIPTLLRPSHHEGRLLVDGGLLNPLPVAPTLRDFTDLTIAVDVNGPADVPVGDVDGESVPPHPAEHAVPAALLPRPLQAYAQRIAEFIDAHTERKAAPHGPSDPSVFDLLGRSFDLVQTTITRLKLAAQPPDLLVSIPRNACAFYEFYRADELITLGRLQTRATLARWRESAAAGNASPK
ncbi:patatin-like phospholipase family protein [Dokdonella sp.]|uniref:patatin-like phospholipase family protein n=1 Tax=Dokdonella sp. TaxID=2291710 RepID=UPI0031BE24CA|nr:patatin-like phospholipase family protein [Dokdonella sp.]